MRTKFFFGVFTVFALVFLFFLFFSGVVRANGRQPENTGGATYTAGGTGGGYGGGYSVGDRTGAYLNRGGGRIGNHTPYTWGDDYRGGQAAHGGTSVTLGGGQVNGRTTYARALGGGRGEVQGGLTGAAGNVGACATGDGGPYKTGRYTGGGDDTYGPETYLGGAYRGTVGRGGRSGGWTA